MDGGVYLLLDVYFFEHLLFSIAYLIPTVITWRLKKRTECEAEFRALNYISLGFFVGFIFYILGGLAGAYIYQIPILPLKLHQEGVPAETAARVAFLYNIVFKAIYLIAVYTSLLLVAYGLYKMLNERCRETLGEKTEEE